MGSVADFIQDEATVTVEGGGEPTEITYKPTRMTAATTAQLARYIDDGDALAFARHICSVFTKWNLKGPLYGEVPVRDDHNKYVLDDDGTEVTERKLLVEDGEIVPLNPEVLQYVPQPVLSFLWREVNSNMNPDPPTARGSRRR